MARRAAPLASPALRRRPRPVRSKRAVGPAEALASGGHVPRGRSGGSAEQDDRAADAARSPAAAALPGRGPASRRDDRRLGAHEGLPAPPGAAPRDSVRPRSRALPAHPAGRGAWPPGPPIRPALGAVRGEPDVVPQTLRPRAPGRSDRPTVAAGRARARLGGAARADPVLHECLRCAGIHVAPGGIAQRRQGGAGLQSPGRVGGDRRRAGTVARPRRLRGQRRRPAGDDRRRAGPRVEPRQTGRRPRADARAGRAPDHRAGDRRVPIGPGARERERQAGLRAMRVTILTQYYPPEIGAPQARLSELASALVRRGHEVTVLTAMPSYPVGKIYPGYGGFLSQERRGGARVIRTPIFPTQRADFLGRLANYFSFACSAGILGTFLLRRCEYLIVESPPLFLGFTGLWLSWRTRAAMVFNVSDLWPETAVRLGVVRAGSLGHRVAAWLEGLCYRHAAVVSGQTKTIVASIAERFPGCRTYHFSNGVNTRVFHPDRRTAAARATLVGDTPDACVALYAGLHGLAQGLDQVLDAAGTFRADPKLRLVLVGDGPAKEGLMQHARERGLSNVRFLDPRPSDQVPPLVAAADILVVPLATHIPGATPSKLYEAMASGRPVVLVAGGEPAAFVREHRVGIVVAPGDARGLVEALRTLSADAVLRQELGANGRRTAERLFDKLDIDNAFIEYLEHNQRAAPAGGRVPRPAPSGPT